MGVKFTVAFQAVAQTAAVDFFEQLIPADRGAKLIEAHITQTTEVGDAQAEHLRFAIKRGVGAVTSGSGGSTATPQSKVPGITFSGSACEINNTTKCVAGSGTLTVLEEHAEHVANGFHYIAPEGDEYEFAGQSRIVIGLEAAPADSVTFDGVLVFELVGGI